MTTSLVPWKPLAKACFLYLLLSVFCLGQAWAAANKVYWTSINSDTILRADLDGSNVEVIVAGLNDPRGIAVDSAGGKIYWTDTGADTIKRANVDGSNIQTLVSGLNNPFGIALDLTNGKIYWAETSGGKIGRADLDGSNASYIVNQASVIDVAVDLTNSKIYYVAQGDDLYRANLDGSGAGAVINNAGGGQTWQAVALDVAANKVYLKNNPNNNLDSAALDGTGLAVLAGALGIIYDIYVDRTNSLLYYASNSANVPVRRSNLDGTGLVDLVTSAGNGISWGVALYVPPAVPPAAVNIPTLTTYGLLIMMAALLLMGLWLMRARRQA